MLERSGAVSPVPSRMTVYRILVRHGLVEPPGVRRRKRSDYKRWQRDRPMQLWQMDIVGGVMLVDPVTGELTEAKIVTGVDDHSRYCVIASVVERALQAFGVPEEVLTDNGKQFTDRFGQGGEVLFDRICRENGIAHRLTQPASPTATGKVERFHQTLRRELLDDCGAFESIQEAQAALDAWVEEYNSVRPHQALDMQSPGDRFTPMPEQERDVLGLKVPGCWRWCRSSGRLLRCLNRPKRCLLLPLLRRWRGWTRAGRWSLSGWCLRVGICRWRASSSGWGRPARG